MTFVLTERHTTDIYDLGALARSRGRVPPAVQAVGHCPGCGLVLTTADARTGRYGTKYPCHRCGKRPKKEELR